MSSSFHSLNLRQYVCYLSEISGWETISIGEELIVYNGLRDSLFNYVFCSNGITESEFVEILEYLRERKWEVSWSVESSMTVLQIYLSKYKIRRTSNPKKAFLDLSDYVIPTDKIDNSITLARMSKLEEVKLFDSLSSRIFWHRPNVLLESFRGIEKSDPNRLQFFFILIEKKPVGICGFYLENQVACFYADGVLSEYRKNGIASQAILKRLALVKELGCKSVIAHCINSNSERLYRRIGFKMLGNLGLYYSQHT